MEKLNIVYIGAGSHRFSGGLFRNIVAAKDLHPMNVVLMDVDEQVLGWMKNLLQNMVTKAGVDVSVEATTDLREALENADFVYKSISIGAQKAEWFDNYVPVKFGIVQNTGDTCGPGGFFRAMRCTYPVMEIAKAMKELCPKAVLLNYTNPQAQIVTAAKRVHSDLQFIGLCHELFGGMKAVKLLLEELGVKVDRWEDFDIQYAGVNHFAWLTSVKLNGEELFPRLVENAAMAFNKNIGGRKFNWYLLDKYKTAFPYPGSRHVAEFMPEYFNYFNHKEAFGITQIRDVYNLSQSHKGKLMEFNLTSRDFYKDLVPTPTDRGEKAMEMTVAWRDSLPDHHVVNLPNHGFVSNLPENAIIEIPGYFKDGKMIGLEMAPLPDEIAKLVEPFCKLQEMSVEAALNGDRDLVVKAMQDIEPMTKFIEDDEAIEHMVDIMLYYQQDWLPAFKENGAVLSKSELEKRKYWVSKKDLNSYGQAKKVKYPPREELKEKAIFAPKEL